MGGEGGRGSGGRICKHCREGSGEGMLGSDSTINRSEGWGRGEEGNATLFNR